MRRKRKLQRQVKQENVARDDRIQRKIVRINEELRVSVDSETDREEKRAVEIVKKNAKYFFSYARRKAKTRLLVGPLVVKEEMVSADREMATVLQDHYRDVYTVPRFQDVESVINT